MPPNLRILLETIGYRASSELYARVRDLLGGSFEPVRQLQRDPSIMINVSDLGEAEVRRWLLALPVDPSSSLVLVAWVGDGIAAEMPYLTAVDRYDDLWYPASDDVVVVWPDGTLLLLDHEERFSFGAPSANDG
jgi:hypothetical protein